MRQSLKLLPVLIVALALILTGAAPAFAVYNPDFGRPGKPVILNGQLEVQFEADVSASKLSTASGQVKFGITTLDRSLEKIEASQATRMFPWRNNSDAIVGNNNLSKFYIITYPEDKDIATVIEELEKNPYIRSVSPVYAIPVDVQPNDPSFAPQWGLKKTQDTLAWEDETGSDTAKIAIIDSGVLYSHSDLRDNIWINAGEDIDNDFVVMDSGDINGVDDDANSMYDDLIGYDFFTGFSGDVICLDADCGGWDNDPIDYNGHGTHCAGIAAAVTNNANDVAGFAGGWGGGNFGPNAGARIMCIRVGASGRYTDDPEWMERGFINSASAASGIDYAARNGATVVNCSFGMSETSAMKAALLKCDTNGISVYHSAGNDNVESGDFADFGYWTPSGQKVVMSIASSDNTDRKSSFSNYGTWIDVAAPGENILATYSDHYTPVTAYLDGTSMSTPMVCGLAALIKSHMPEYDKFDIDSLIYYNADPMLNEPLFMQGKMGSGRINAANVMAILPTAKFSAGPVLVGQAPLTIDFTDESPNSPTSWQWDFGDGGSSMDQNPSHTYTDYGFKTVSLTVDEPRGTVTEIQKNLIMITADTVKYRTVDINPDTVSVGTILTMPVYLHNKFLTPSFILAFKLRRSDNHEHPGFAYLQSITTAGTRTDYFEQVNPIFTDNFYKRYAYEFRSNDLTGSEYLPPDTGVIVYLNFEVLADIPQDVNLYVEDTVMSGVRYTHINSLLYEYIPVSKRGYLAFYDLYERGDVDLSGSINLLDITFLINYLYKDGAEPENLDAADVNGDGSVNLLDVTYLINYLYKEGPPPPP